MASTSELSIYWVHYFRTERSLLSFSDLAMLSAYFLECLGCFSEGYGAQKESDAPTAQRFNDTKAARRF